MGMVTRCCEHPGIRFTVVIKPTVHARHKVTCWNHHHSVVVATGQPAQSAGHCQFKELKNGIHTCHNVCNHRKVRPCSSPYPLFPRAHALAMASPRHMVHVQQLPAVIPPTPE